MSITEKETGNQSKSKGIERGGKEKTGDRGEEEKRKREIEKKKKEKRKQKATSV